MGVEEPCVRETEEFIVSAREHDPQSDAVVLVTKKSRPECKA